MMKEYKRSSFIMLKETVYALAGGVVTFFIATFAVGYFMPDETTNVYLIAGVITAVVVLFLLYLALIASAIRFEVDGNELRYYKGNKLRNTFNIKSSSIRYVKRSKGIDSDIEFYVTDHNNGGREVQINASPLGGMRFDRMFEDLKQSIDQEEVLTVKEGA